MMPSLPQAGARVALVTGGGRGVGAAIAAHLAAGGMTVAVGARTAAQVDAVARDSAGLALVGDVTNVHDVDRWVADVEAALGPIALLVNGAGAFRRPAEPWADDPGGWWRVFTVNVLGTFACCRTVVPHMIARRSGRIVNVSSAAAYVPADPDRLSTGAYEASKAAVTRFTEVLAARARPHGVCAFAISPGLVRTEMTAEFSDRLPWSTPRHAAQLVEVLASGRADALTGRFVHAVDDDIEALIARAGEVVEQDLHVTRLCRLES